MRREFGNVPVNGKAIFSQVPRLGLSKFVSRRHKDNPAEKICSWIQLGSGCVQLRKGGKGKAKSSVENGAMIQRCVAVIVVSLSNLGMLSLYFICSGHCFRSTSVLIRRVAESKSLLSHVKFHSFIYSFIHSFIQSWHNT